ncbi:hypothetical protein GCM10017608_00540 [Agromyces luteolus]|uniref:Uncharacterized protein n=1 Tax=Agromyces luteolus TaxID=88373 RepID=A0A7C9HHR5_9MICO|nr:hypothetical protein [Agromyces luteolus]MUN05582.1 hypothetical protein [Agromyces luteolus]GLK26122.1 hypothetical protein GCM10017608_00540 [Agromyces luteolus]
MEVGRALRSPHVIALVVLGAAGLVVLWTMTSWIVQADSGAVFVDGDPDAQRRAYLMATLPYLLSGAAASAILGALVGLPLLVGARLVALRRARAADEGGPAAPTAP